VDGDPLNNIELVADPEEFRCNHERWQGLQEQFA
jgi:hypothetical protein